jgi:hypothetical protein
LEGPQEPSGVRVPLGCALVLVLEVVVLVVVVVVLDPVAVVVVVDLELVVVVLVLVDEVLVVLVLVLLELLLEAVPVREVRYQLAGGSPRQVPTVTAAKLLAKVSDKTMTHT